MRWTDMQERGVSSIDWLLDALTSTWRRIRMDTPDVRTDEVVDSDGDHPAATGEIGVRRVVNRNLHGNRPSATGDLQAERRGDDQDPVPE